MTFLVTVRDRSCAEGPWHPDLSSRIRGDARHVPLDRYCSAYYS